MEDLKDYAYPAMMAERALKELHRAMLDRDLDKAVEFGVEASIQVSDLLRIVYTQRKEPDKRLDGEKARAKE